MNSIKVVVADDHEIFLDGMEVLLKKVPHVNVVGNASNGQELIKIAKELKPDVVITDIKMPLMNGIEATKILTSDLPGTGIIALSMFDEESLIVDMLEAGAKGYLLKNAQKEEIINAIESVYHGQTYYCKRTSAKLVQMIVNSNYNPHKKIQKPELSEREIEIVRLICTECSNKEIANQLKISPRTVEGHRERLEEKLGVKNAAGIVIYAIKNRIYEI